MYNNYTETLESYLIPAEEGFLEKAAAVLGYTVIGLLSLPLVLIGGVGFVNGIHVAKEARKLKKAIKSNGGNSANYGAASSALLKSYSAYIHEIQEPRKFSDVLHKYQSILTLVNKADSIRTEFIHLDHYNTSDNVYSKLLSKITALNNALSQLTAKDIDLSNSENNLQSVQYSQSKLVRISQIESEIIKTIDSESQADEWYIFATMNTSDPKYWDHIEKNIEARKCIYAFDDFVNTVMKNIDSVKLMELCKFAVNPKAKKSLKS